MIGNSQLDSLLTREFVESIIKIEKEALIEHGALIAKLHILHHSGKTIMVGLSQMPASGNKKRKMLQNLGMQLRAEDGSIKEALFIAESWMVKATNPDCDKFAPSEHPAREEVIVIVGRNEEKSRSLMALQPFSRDRKGAPVWKEPLISISEDGSVLTYEGILDDLFIGAVQVLVPEMKA